MFRQITLRQQGVGGSPDLVKHIFPNRVAFAAVLEDGSVVTWGNKRSGGDCSSVQEKLKAGKIKHIYSTNFAFAAVLDKG